MASRIFMGKFTVQKQKRGCPVPWAPRFISGVVPRMNGSGTFSQRLSRGFVSESRSNRCVHL
jgi:hypothetical protein